MHDIVALGIDLGTTDLKALLLKANGAVIGSVRQPVKTMRPRDGWSEQDPADWWDACLSAMAQLRDDWPQAYADIRAIGLAGQMHGIVLLDAHDRCLRPAILWNDSRAIAEAGWLAGHDGAFAEATGSVPMAGLSAPKLLWLSRNEPATMASLDCVLLPKDYLRFRLTGERVTDLSDASGTGMLDVRNRRWFEPVVAAAGLAMRQLPPLIEGTQPSGRIAPSIADSLGLDRSVIVAGGGGDNPVAAAGIGAVEAGASLLTLGTSGAIFTTTDRPSLNIAQCAHTYCHAVPDRWYTMGAILAGASCLRWVAVLLGQPDERTLLALVEDGVPLRDSVDCRAPIFLPYLSGERTPHNDPFARASFANLGNDCSPALLGYAVLEGVGFALLDALNAVEASGAKVGECHFVGGGAASPYWAQLLATILGRDLITLSGSERSAAIGAAKLGLVAMGCHRDILAKGLPVKRTYCPDPRHQDILGKRHEAFRSLFPATRLPGLRPNQSIR